MSLIKMISKLYYGLTGWKIGGRYPLEIKKAILVAAPHTSNYDFGYSLAALYLMDARVRYLAKKELVESPFMGFIFKGTGAISVDRDNSRNMVRYMVDLFNRSDNMIIMLAPEGSRSGGGKWKTGFYQAALQAGVPIVLASLDYKKKIADVGPHFLPTGDYQKDMQVVKEFYSTVVPRYPDKYTGEIC